MTFLLLLLAGAPLDELWAAAPDPVLRAVAGHWRITTANSHEWLCEALGCRCAALEPTPAAAA